MANRSNPLSRIRLVYRRSSTLLRCVVLAAVVLSIAAIVALGAVTRQYRMQTEEYRQQAALLEQENRKLEKYISQLGTVQGVKRIAREELDLVDPDDIFFQTNETTNPQ